MAKDKNGLGLSYIFFEFYGPDIPHTALDYCYKYANDAAAFSDRLLTYWGLVTPYGDVDLGQHWLR